MKPVEEPKSDEKGREKTFSLEEIAKHNNKVCPLHASEFQQGLTGMVGCRMMPGLSWTTRFMMLLQSCRGTPVGFCSGHSVQNGLIRVYRWRAGDLGLCWEGHRGCYERGG